MATKFSFGWMTRIIPVLSDSYQIANTDVPINLERKPQEKNPRSGMWIRWG